MFDLVFKMVVSRGEIIVDNGQWSGKPGWGTFLVRTRSEVPVFAGQGKPQG